MCDYRLSHLGDKRGQIYEHRFQEGRTGILWQEVEKPALHRLLERLAATHPGPLLDFAVGTGRVTSLAAEFFPDITGIDVSPDMLIQARVKLPRARLLCCDVTRNPPKCGQFRVILLFRFLLNAQPALRLAVLRWLREVIHPDGVLLLNLHRATTSANGLVALAADLWQKKRWRTYSPARLRKILKISGFSAERLFATGFFPGRHATSWAGHPAIVTLERFFSRIPGFSVFGENQLYLCRPTLPGPANIPANIPADYG